MRPQEGAFPYVKDAPVRRIYLQIIPRKRHASQAKALCASPFSFNSNYKRKLSRKARRALTNTAAIRQGYPLSTAPPRYDKGLPYKQHRNTARRPESRKGFRGAGYRCKFSPAAGNQMISSASLSVTGNAACGSVWYQYAVAAPSDCCGRYRPPLRQPRS